MKEIAHIKRVFLLFNWGTFQGHFYYRRDAVKCAKGAVGLNEDWRKYFQIIKGDIRIHAEVMPPMPKGVKVIN